MMKQLCSICWPSPTIWSCQLCVGFIYKSSPLPLTSCKCSMFDEKHCMHFWRPLHGSSSQFIHSNSNLLGLFLCIIHQLMQAHLRFAKVVCCLLMLVTSPSQWQVFSPQQPMQMTSAEEYISCTGHCGYRPKDGVKLCCRAVHAVMLHCCSCF